MPSLNAAAWAQLLRQHPEKAKVKQTIESIVFGEPIGFCGPRFIYVARNPSSSEQALEAILKDIAKRDNARKIIGPFTSASTPGFRSSRIHSVPEDETKLRIIHDLSFPPGASINDGILSELFPVSFEKFERAIELIRMEGPGAFLLCRD